MRVKVGLLGESSVLYIFCSNNLFFPFVGFEFSENECTCGWSSISCSVSYSDATGVHFCKYCKLIIASVQVVKACYVCVTHMYIHAGISDCRSIVK